MTPEELLDTYYRGLPRKSGWDAVLAEDFEFIGGRNMTKPEPTIGKAAYQAVIDRFSRVFTAMRVKDRLVAKDRAYVLANYDYAFPNGRKANGDVLEVWRIKDGKLVALTIFFDTAAFEALTKSL
jgi:ketosteroid isomerase-like protein